MVQSVAVALFTSAAHAQPVVVNEFSEGTGMQAGGTDWIELLLVEELTAAQLERFHVGDSNALTATKLGAVRLSSLAAIAPTFEAGTLVVVSGSGGVPEDLVYDPAAGDFEIVLHAGSPYAVGNGTLVSLDVWDMVWVDTDGTSGSAALSAQGFGVNFDPNPGVFGLIADVAIAPPTNDTGAALVDGPDAVLDPASWLVSVPVVDQTPSAPNGGGNTDGILLLRDADADGIANVADNCVDAPNPTQADANQDGEGDACEQLTLQVSAVTPGGQANLRVQNGLPGELVVFAGALGPAGGLPCLAQLGGLCLDFGSVPTTLGSQTTDASGQATLTTTVPLGVPVGAVVTVQAVATRNLTDAEKSAPVQLVVQ